MKKYNIESAVIPEAKLIPIVDSVKNGNTEAFEPLYEASKGMVYFICTQYADKDTAEDLMQDIYVKAITKIDQLKNSATFFGWLKTMTRNYCIDYLRKEKPVVMSAFTGYDDEGELKEMEIIDPHYSRSPEAMLDYKESIALMHKFINELNDDEKLIFTDAAIFNMSDSEIMKTYQLSRLKVKRIKEKAAAMLGVKYHEEEKRGADLRSLPISTMVGLLHASTAYAAEIPEDVSRKIWKNTITEVSRVASSSIEAGLSETVKTGKDMVSSNTVASKTAASAAGTGASIATKSIAMKAGIAALISASIVGTATIMNKTETAVIETTAAVKATTEATQEVKTSAFPDVTAEDYILLNTLSEALKANDKVKTITILEENFNQLYDLQFKKLQNNLLVFDGTDFVSEGIQEGLVLETNSFNADYKRYPNKVTYNVSAYYGTFHDMEANGELSSSIVWYREYRKNPTGEGTYTVATYKDGVTSGNLYSETYEIGNECKVVSRVESPWNHELNESASPRNIDISKLMLLDEATGDDPYLHYENITYTLEDEQEPVFYDTKNLLEMTNWELEEYCNHLVYKNEPGNHTEKKIIIPEGTDLNALWTEDIQEEIHKIIEAVYYTGYWDALNRYLNDMPISETSEQKVGHLIHFAVGSGLFKEQQAYENFYYVYEKDQFLKSINALLGHDLSKILETFLSSDGTTYMFEDGGDLGNEIPYVKIENSQITDYGFEILGKAGIADSSITEIYEEDNIIYRVFYNGDSKYPFELKYIAKDYSSRH